MHRDAFILELEQVGAIQLAHSASSCSSETPARQAHPVLSLNRECHDMLGPSMHQVLQLWADQRLMAHMRLLWADMHCYAQMQQMGTMLP